ncbi:MAG: NAD(P)/FAD-dependent oxidoreductase [Rhodoferax sp.]
MKTEFDALIIGGGPAGSSAAILLARAGWSVAQVEKQTFPRRKVCGECIAASNLPLLQALGIGPAFEQAAGPELRKVALMHGAHKVVAELPPAPGAHFRWGRALGRETLDTLLMAQARLAGVTVMQPWSAVRTKGSAGHWRCDVRATDSGTLLTLGAAVLIDAHGSWEALPSARARHSRVHGPSDLLAFKANFRQTRLAKGLLPVLAFSGGYGGMVRADGGLTTVACCIRRDHLEANRRKSPGLSAGEVIETLLKEQCAGVKAALQGATREGAWLAAGPLNTGIHLSSGDGIFRIGNAAAEAHPIIGEGMSMALQSAWLLCAQLLHAKPGQALSDPLWQREQLRRYVAQWRLAFAPRLRLAAVLAHVAMRPMLVKPMLALLQRWPGLLTLGAGWGGKTRCAADPAAIAIQNGFCDPAMTQQRA